MTFSSALGRDHPRVCGEKFDMLPLEIRQKGSPPRMRGKGPVNRRTGKKPGITPAYAGKSARPSGRPVIWGDHPRVCGEKRIAGLEEESTAGSPPHVRGKGRCHPARGWRSRITPAYAGKRSACSSSASGPPDHPRMCGEKGCCKFSSRNHSGSPPRMRGKVLGTGKGCDGVGITPACAGKRSGPSPAAVPAGPAGSCPASRPSQFPPRMTVISPRP